VKSLPTAYIDGCPPMTSQHDIRQRPLNEEPAAPPPAAAQEQFRAGPDDLVILPLVTLAVAVRRLLRAFFLLLIHIIDWLFPIVLQLVRFPLFTLRILGDAIAWLLKAVVRILPVGGGRRQAWHEWVSSSWAWLRSKLSYRAFEEWLHHAFESGMAWVFKRCKRLTPRAALLVILGAILWLPISFGAATVMHIVLAAKIAVWPPWVQFLHPLATIIAKSKLLVLPVYPAAWPQAKQHPFVQGLLAGWQSFMQHYLARKTVHRYRQTEAAATAAGEALHRAALSVGLAQLGRAVLTAINDAGVWAGRMAWALSAWIVKLMGKVPLFGPIVQRYETQYAEANHGSSEPLSEKTRDFFARWSIKFTAQYYEDKEREEAAKGHA